MNIEDAAADVYGVPPGEFTSRRTALARDAKSASDTELSKAIAGLRKPTTSAWAVNMLARHRAERVAEITELGDLLRDAQDALDAPQLRELGRQRSALVRAVTREAVALAEELGTVASAAVSEEIAQTLQTAMIDADAAALVASGTLVKPLTAAGWGIGEGGDVIAFPTAAQRAKRRAAGADGEPGSEGTSGKGSSRKSGTGGATPGATPAAARGAAARERTSKRAADHASAQRELDDAEETLQTARAEAERLRSAADSAAERRSALRDEVQELTRQLREAEGELADVEEEARGIRRSRDEAKRTLTGAERALARARTRIERLD